MSTLLHRVACSAIAIAPIAAAQVSSNGVSSPVPPAAPAVSLGGLPVSLVGFGPLFFSEDNTGVLWTLSPTTGAATNVGFSGVTSNTVGLAPRDATTLFGSIWFDVAVVQANGSGAAVLPNSAEAEGLAFDGATGTLYGAINGSFFTIDTTTGQVLASLPPPPGDVEGLAVGNGGVYGLIGFSGNDSSLHFYSFATGVWTIIGDTGIDWNEVGLAYDPSSNRLYAKGSQGSLLYRIHPGTAATTVVGDTGLAPGGGLAWLGVGGLGLPYCSPAVPNSTGVGGTISATGSPLVTANNVTLRASSLPLQAFGLFLASRTQGNVPQPGGSQGVLCLGGAIGRYVGPGQIQNTGAIGAFELILDLTRTPTPTGLVPIVPGESWNFQTWHRDSIGGIAVSNFTDALRITFM